jgi:hypothetical protein
MKRFQHFLKEQEEFGPFPGEMETDIEPEVEEIIDEPNQDKETMDRIPAPVIKKMDSLPSSSGDDHIKSLVEFQVQVKAMHWATESFAQHKATCDTHAALDAAIDALVESYQGYVGRIRIGGQYTILNYEDIDLNSWLQSAMDHVEGLRGMVKQSDVLNLLDEILAIITKFKYLLSLK